MTSPLTLHYYETAAIRTDFRRCADTGLSFPLLGLFGETGSLLSEVKKKQRDPIAYIGNEDNVLEELGDVLWYLVAVAGRAGLGLADLAINLNCDLANWQSHGDMSLAFSDIEIGSPTMVHGPTKEFEKSSLRLAAEVGLLLSDYRTGNLEQNRSVLKGRLIAVLRALSEAANEAGLSLERAAQANMAKIADRWPDEHIYPPLLDDGFPKHEQLPRTLVVEFREIEVNGRTVSQLTRDGIPIGDPLSDNRADEDDYRFHDVFHLAYAAYLSWSPTLRRLLKVKRKGDPMIDEVEDGARAAIIEEGIATWIFNHAQRLALFEDMESLEYGLLKSVRQFVRGYEVENSPLWLWEEAILSGYEVFRTVRKHRGGRVGVDLIKRRIWFIEP